MKLRLLICAIAFCLFMTGLVHSAEQQPQNQVSGKTPRIIPWIEVNTVSNTSLKYYQKAVAGAKVWDIVIDEMCVSTIADPTTISALYQGLNKDCPGLKILPGIKTGEDQLKRLDNLQGWKLVADSCRLACQITRNNRCVIENETVNKIFINYQDKYPVKRGDVDWEKVEQGLRLLPKDIHYIWYPGVCGERPEERELTVRFIDLVVNTLEHVSVVSLKWSTSRVKTGDKISRPDNQARFGVTVVPICYFYAIDPETTRKKDWKSQDITWLLDNCPEPEIFVYPGSTNFMTCALECASVLYRDKVDQLNRCKESLSTDKTQTE